MDLYLLSSESCFDGPMTARVGSPAGHSCKVPHQMQTQLTHVFATRPHSELRRAPALTPDLWDEPSSHSIRLFLKSQPIVQLLIGQALRPGETADTGHGLCGACGDTQGCYGGKKTIIWRVRDGTPEPRTSANSAYLSVLSA